MIVTASSSAALLVLLLCLSLLENRYGWSFSVVDAFSSPRTSTRYHYHRFLLSSSSSSLKVTRKYFQSSLFSLDNSENEDDKIEEEEEEEKKEATKRAAAAKLLLQHRRGRSASSLSKQASSKTKASTTSVGQRREKSASIQRNANRTLRKRGSIASDLLKNIPSQTTTSTDNAKTQKSNVDNDSPSASSTTKASLIDTSRYSTKSTTTSHDIQNVIRNTFQQQQKRWQQTQKSPTSRKTITLTTRTHDGNIFSTSTIQPFGSSSSSSSYNIPHIHNNPHPGTILLHPTTSSLSLSSARDQKQIIQNEIAVRVATPTDKDDYAIANLRLSVFSDLNYEMRQKFTSKSVDVLSSRREKGATCIIASISKDYQNCDQDDLFDSFVVPFWKEQRYQRKQQESLQQQRENKEEMTWSSSSLLQKEMRHSLFQTMCGGSDTASNGGSDGSLGTHYDHYQEDVEQERRMQQQEKQKNMILHDDRFNPYNNNHQQQSEEDEEEEENILRYDEWIMGSVECSTHEFHDTELGRRRPIQKILYLTEVAVSPDARRCGVGTKLMQGVDELASIRNIESIYLHVDVTNDAAYNLYQKAGYHLIDRTNPSPSSIMYEEFTYKLNLHDGATKGRNHYLMCKHLTDKPTWFIQEEEREPYWRRRGMNEDEEGGITEEERRRRRSFGFDIGW